MTVGIVGYGAIGRLEVDLLGAVGCRILIHDPYALLSDKHSDRGVRMALFDDLLAQSDVISLHTKVTPETRGMMNAEGMNQGTSGNISARYEDRMLITPSAMPYEKMKPDMLASMSLEAEDDSWKGSLKPSSEWHFHRNILMQRSDAGAVVHLHAPFCTVLAIARKPIPACHYMVACFGGHDVRCGGYARYGTSELSRIAVEALEGRTACLLANHGMIAIGDSLRKALWTAIELETLAKQYYHSLLIGGPVMLSDTQIDGTLRAFSGYGLQD